MVLYKLMVVHWSIFTLFIQLAFCASAFTSKLKRCFHLPILIVGSTGQFEDRCHTTGFGRHIGRHVVGS